MITSILIYFFAVMLTIFLIYLQSQIGFFQKSNFRKLFTLFLCFAPLIFIFTLRSNVGTDYDSYLRTFHNLRYTPLSFDVFFHNYVECGWVFLTFFSQVFSDSFILFQFFISLIFFGYLTAIIHEKDRNQKILYIFIAFALLFFHFMNISRQMLAMVMLIYAIDKCFKKEYIKSAFHIFLASLFHKSVLIFLLVILFIKLYDQKDKLKLLQKINVSSIWIEILLLASPIYAYPLTMLIAQIFKLFNFKVFYIADNFNFDFGFLLYTLPLIGIYKYFEKKYNFQKDTQIRILYLLTLVNILFQSFGCMLLVFERLSIYFFAMNLPLFSYMREKINEKDRSHFDKIIYLYFIAYIGVMYIIMNGQGCFPYRFI